MQFLLSYFCFSFMMRYSKLKKVVDAFGTLFTPKMISLPPKKYYCVLLWTVVMFMKKHHTPYVYGRISTPEP